MIKTIRVLVLFGALVVVSSGAAQPAPARGAEIRRRIVSGQSRQIRTRAAQRGWRRGYTKTLVEYGAYPRKGKITLWQSPRRGSTPYGYRYMLEASARKICSPTVSLNGGQAGAWMRSIVGITVGSDPADPYADTIADFVYNVGGWGYGTDTPCGVPGGITRSGTITMYVRAKQYQYHHRGYGTHYADLYWCSEIGCQWYYVFE